MRNINTEIIGNLHGETWGGFEGFLPFSFTHKSGVKLLDQLRCCVTSDFVKETVKISGAAYVTLMKNNGRTIHIIRKHFNLSEFPSLSEIVIGPESEQEFNEKVRT